MNVLSERKLDNTIDFILNRIDLNIKQFKNEVFPSPESKDYIYRDADNFEWTPGFYTGMLWLAFELTGNSKYMDTAMSQMDSYKNRIVNKICVDTHDLGFIYSLSCVAAYKITGDEEAKKTAIMAADYLISRFHEKGGYIQAWGIMNNNAKNRLIIDCLLNIPFLFWASEATDNPKYANIARAHLRTTLSVITRPDYTTHHTYFFDYDGTPLYGQTAQGFSDTSCWARGQAWGVTGTAINYKYEKEDYVRENHDNITNTFISKLPADFVPYWDMDFSPADNEPRDTSSAAIAACGILEMSKSHTNNNHMKCVSDMLNSLIDNFLTTNIHGANGILSDGMYNRNRGCSPESNLWGDYFFFEAIMRIKKPDIKLYW